MEISAIISKNTSSIRKSFEKEINKQLPRCIKWTWTLAFTDLFSIYFISSHNLVPEDSKLPNAMQFLISVS